ncbi:hypothetical protein FLAG1_09901 [Fusarium langsethiae]|uniref:Uncharacterized protein n=1 Tax=Fusarium langsethiae TaxID=179993 RepID=A0A0N0DBU7_FUSLA|nr:hypothetical protein FLAG1_09901 [Fusarium langsethiae]
MRILLLSSSQLRDPAEPAYLDPDNGSGDYDALVETFEHERDVPRTAGRHGFRRTSPNRDGGTMAGLAAMTLASDDQQSQCTTFHDAKSFVRSCSASFYPIPRHIGPAQAPDRH